MSLLEAAVELSRGANAAVPFRLDARFDIDLGYTVLLGPSGAGKSTLLLALLGALKPDRAQLRLAGRVLADSDAGVALPVRDRGIGVVLQDALLFPHLDARANVAFGLRGRDREARAEAELERVGARSLARRYPADLSGGERQRVALARALAPAPRALLLDEPFSALDPVARETLGALMLALQRERGIPFLHVTHDLAEAFRLADHVIRLEGGRVVAAGSPGALLAAGGTSASPGWAGSDNLLLGRVLGTTAGEGATTVDLGGVVVTTGPIGLPVGERVALRLRAEDVLLALEAYRGSSARNVLAGRIEALHPGPEGVEVEVSTPLRLRALVTMAAARELTLRPGAAVHLLIKATSFRRIA